MVKKKFTDYDMRDDFSFPVYVGYELIEINGIKGIDPDNRYAGLLVRMNGETYLELSDNPTKKDYDSSESIYNGSDMIDTQEDSHDWYASTWDGSLQFVFHKYFKMDSSFHLANDHFGGDISKWIVSDYSIVKQHVLLLGVEQAKLTLDHIYSWFGIFRPEKEWKDMESLKFSDLTFENVKFSLTVGAEGKERHPMHFLEKTAYMFVRLNFDEIQTREFTYRLAVAVRDLFQILTGKAVGISRIVLNSDQSYNRIKENLSPRNEEENWLLNQSFLPDYVEEKISGFAIPYQQISDRFQEILMQYFHDDKLQKLVESYLIVDQFRVPVDTQIITLVSAIESYYRDARYSEGGKKIKCAFKKLERLTALLDDPNKIIKGSTHGNITTTSDLLKEMIDARDYVIHGDKADKYTSEAELVPDLISFKRLIRQAIVNIVSLQVKSNN
ncbi:hypothetical protein [Loigolactobacillus bifermentans]|uniref:Uncharacterized protein n=1 Tax=Loigolactobacillus bifermentans DSM 20003 TaxID=1423726 RepID=A0A0R1GSR8_9LACO|nr:hypothetical protein [Loigolactobacillus bifermentans]KRK34546.1 hypothetical protein FC07_GL000560 [Loigolactobacillus bifermentans DSM 20003]QGG61322.1 hypothetical protein LB003_13065 [Loigolactobacillus bifermentans]